MANIPITTPMSPGLYAVVQQQVYEVVDQYWNRCIADLLLPAHEPNMYAVMSSLHNARKATPRRANRTFLSDQFCQFWVGIPQTATPTQDEAVRREAAAAIGGIYHDIVLLATNGADGGASMVPFVDARAAWEAHNAVFLKEELNNLQEWIKAN